MIMTAQPLLSRWEWPVAAFLVAVHASALILCIAFPSWRGLLVFLALYLATGLGVTVGYHRKIAHQSFRCPEWFEYTLAVLGLLSGEGPPLFWAAVHRQHHRLSDRPGDPHSPRDGFWWSHWLWMMAKIRRRQLGVLYGAYAPDLVRHRVYRRFEATYFYWQAAFATAIVAAGWWIGSWRMALSFLGYGYFLRMVVVLHATWMVNSVSHLWGYRRYDTGDASRNNAVVALLAHGEGWHNNHHHAPPAANHGHAWWEFDLSFLVIAALGLATRPLAWIGLDRCRLISDVRVYSRATGRVWTWLPSQRLADAAGRE